MANNMILNMIRLESKDQKIPQKRLCYGICSEAYLSKCFRKGTEMDKLMLEAFLQRLGISTRRYTFILKDGEYDLFALRERMRMCIWNNEPEKIDGYIEEYLKKMADLRCAENLHYQVLGLLRSYSLAQMKVSYEEQLKNVLEALAQTKMTLDSIDFENCSYSEIELLLIIRTAMILEKIGRTNEAEHIYENCYKLQIKAPYNNNEFPHVFAKINYEMTKIHLAKKEYAKALEVAEYGIKMLADGNKILYLWEMMEMYLKAEEMVLPKGEVSEKREIYGYYPSVKNVIKDCYAKWNADEHCPMYYEYKIYSLSTMVAQRRRLQGETQESFSIKSNCNYATIERLERGVNETQTRIRYSILNEVGLPIEKCYYMLIADNMKVKREYFDYTLEMDRGNIDEAKVLLEKVKSSIDLTITINKQAMELSDFEIEKRRNEYTPRMQLRKGIEILGKTLPEKYLQNPEVGLLYGNEEVIIQQIIKNYEQTQGADCAIELITKILKGYTKPQVIGDEFVALYLGILRMLESRMANLENFELANELVHTNLRKCIQHDLAGTLFYWLYDSIWNKEKQNMEITKQDTCVLDTAITIAAVQGYSEKQTFISRYKKKLLAVKTEK